MQLDHSLRNLQEVGKQHELPLTTTWTERETNPCGQKRNKARSSLEPVPRTREDV